MNSIRGSSSLSTVLFVRNILKIVQSNLHFFLAGPLSSLTCCALDGHRNRCIKGILRCEESLRLFRFRGVDAVIDGSIPGLLGADCPSSRDGNDPFGRRSENDLLSRDISLDNCRGEGIR